MILRLPKALSILDGVPGAFLAAYFAVMFAGNCTALTWSPCSDGWLLIDRNGAALTKPRTGPIGGGPWSSYWLVRPYSLFLLGTEILDSRGKVVLRPKKRQAFFSRPYDGLILMARIRADAEGNGEAGPFGFVNLRGQLVIPPIFGSAQLFWDGLAPARPYHHRRWGYIDEHGKWVVTPTYESAGMLFPVGLGAVQIQSHPEKWGFVDSRGRLAFTLPAGWHVGSRPLWPGSFTRDRLAIVTTTGKKGRLFGAINTDGKLVIPMHHWQHLFPFHNGRAMVAMREHGHVRWGIINMKGQYIVRPKFYNAARKFHDQLAWVQLGRDVGSPASYAIINRHGKTVLTSKTLLLNASVYDGRIIVGKMVGGYHLLGFANLRGKVVIRFQYREAYPFYGGVAAVELPPKAAKGVAVFPKK